MQPIITEKLKQIAELCRTHHVRRVSVFGSAVRDDFDPKHSDVDFLIEFEPLPYPLSMENYWNSKEAFITLFERQVDFMHEGRIRNSYLIESIHDDQKTFYVA